MKEKLLSVIRFAIFVEAGIASILYVLYVPHRYFGDCNPASQPESSGILHGILCPAPSFTEVPHPAFYIAVDVLIATAVLYILYAGYLYVTRNSKS